MIRLIVQTVAALVVAVGLAACAMPPSDAIVGAQHHAGPRLALGRNQAGETCTLQRSDTVSMIYCGAYEDPAGRVVVARDAADPGTFLTSSTWREGFDHRYSCRGTEQTTILGNPAVKLSCVWREGGWPQVAIATRIGDALYVADGVGPAETALPQAIGVLAGQVTAQPMPRQDITGQETRQDANAALNMDGAGAIEAVIRQTERGALQNRLGNFAAAEVAYHAAVTILERKLGIDNPALAVPLARQALQISNQGRFSDSDPLYGRAIRLAALHEQPDPVAQPMVLHLRALDQLNRQQPAAVRNGLALLDQAEAGFAALVPPDALVPPVRRSGRADRSAAERMADAAATTALLSDQTAANALNGLIETRRYRAVGLKFLGQLQEADAALAASRALYIGRDPRLVARYDRSAGMVAAALGDEARAVTELDDAVTAFADAQNGSRALAVTQMLLAANLLQRQDDAGAVAQCHDATRILLELKAGVTGSLLTPCLHAFDLEARQDPAAAKPLLEEMFAAAQLAQGTITSQQIARATARMAIGAHNPDAAKAIRAEDTAIARLDELYRKRAEAAADKEKAAEVATLDNEIDQAQAARESAGQALQAAAPGYAQLVQESTTAADTQALLQPDEALAAIVLGDSEGWTLLVRRDRIIAGRIEGGAARVNPLVQRFRASVEPGKNGDIPTFDAAAARQLYTAVLGPVAAGLAGVDTLTVAPSGSLLSVPFGALLTGGVPLDGMRNAPFLIRTMAVSHVPSVASFANLRRIAKADQAKLPWFGLGDPQPPTLQQAERTYPVDRCGESASLLAGFQPLPGSLKELDAARELLAGNTSDEMVGGAFTAKNVLTASLQNYRVLHFATHALLPGDLRCQSEPAIITSTAADMPDAGGALLTASEIEETLKLNAQMVILAACNTGGANGEAGESLSGLARSFLFAGARSLLITHWEANDASTTYLTAVFLREWQAHPNAGPAMALANAQRLMLDAATGDRAWLAHPFYWAVVALIGGEGPGKSGTVAAGLDRSPNGG